MNETVILWSRVALSVIVVLVLFAIMVLKSDVKKNQKIYRQCKKN